MSTLAQTAEARPYIVEDAGEPEAVCAGCGTRAPVKVQRGKSGNIAVAYLPDGWRFRAPASAICDRCEGMTE